MTGQAEGTGAAVRVGSLVKVQRDTGVIGMVASMALEGSSPARRVLSVDLLGEITNPPAQGPLFRRGVSLPPTLGDPVVLPTEMDIAAVYSRPSSPHIRIGTLSDNKSQPAFVMINELLSNHFAVVGSSGSGKSCTVSLIIAALLEKEPNAHVILLDPHNEYSVAFEGVAELINVENQDLPFWVFNREEAIRVMIRGGSEQEQEVQALILKDAIRAARREYAGLDRDGPSITVDTPVPFLVNDFRRLLKDGMGSLGQSDRAGPYRHLLARLDSLQEDSRFLFMFGETFQSDVLSKLIGRLLRIPVAGKPLTIFDLSGVPPDVSDVVVSVICRLLFDFTLWADPARRPPVLLVCEEAHRYLPADGGTAFAACTQAISRIAREGRKYGLSLALVSQRPTELSLSALSQCGTIFALRLGNELDQRFVEGALPDAGRTMVRKLSSLSVRQTVVFGQGVTLPMVVQFDDIPPTRVPHSQSACFSEAWKDDSAGAAFRDEGIVRWRAQKRDAIEARG